jgi:DNA invertase Pin-like site-specific DNA recombinase
MKSRVKFIAVDFPDANDLMLHIMAAFAEYERRQISVRTKEAMASAKLRGITFGSYGKQVLSRQNRTNADLFALSLVPTIHRLNEMGLCTVRSIAEELNRERILTYRKGTHKWHLQTVHHLLKRIETLKSKT